MKWILGVSAIAVIVGLAATMTVPGQTVTPDQATLKLFPAETQGIGFVDVAGLRGAPLFNELILQKIPQFPPELNEFTQQTGFNPVQDVDRVTAGHVSAQEMLFIVQARYDHFKVEQFLKDKADHLSSETYLGRVIYSPEAQTSPEHGPGGVTFIDNLIIAGNVSAIKQAIDRMAATAPSVFDNSALMAQIATITAGSQIWAVGSFDPSMLGHVPAIGAAGNLVQSLKGGTYQIRLDQDVHVKASSDFTTADMAKATTDMLRGVIAMAKLQVSQDDSLSRLLNGLNIENSGANLTVSLTASGDLLKQLTFSKAKLGAGFIH